MTNINRLSLHDVYEVIEDGDSTEEDLRFAIASVLSHIDEMDTLKTKHSNEISSITNAYLKKIKEQELRFRFIKSSLEELCHLVQKFGTSKFKMKEREALWRDLGHAARKLMGNIEVGIHSCKTTTKDGLKEQNN